ncbi:hypothetical protein SAMN02746065_104126 [Desulfocicer vacuolatum DSM 3385]|uniref:Uncharacterized protein n=2 Tax=Desulfocicer vacuolatum TaxID=2298 RepID=A0A1W2A4W3_9BACT|nr:hypothetical protein SAMN02746065_104126 [Desulfocicer vacuolatum DSM 3385]
MELVSPVAGEIDFLEADTIQVIRTRESDVTRVVHSSLIMRPIYELEARRLNTEEEGADIRDFVDLMWVAFAILDSVSELTEYHVGASRKEVLEKVMPAIKKQLLSTEAFSHEALYALLKKVFDHLVNRQNRYLPFEYRYYDGIVGRFNHRKFWLIKAVYTGKGQETLFSLTDEGYAAYFGLHETSALDSTAIGNLRIKLLIERGNVDDAISVAEQNNKQCTRKAHDIRNTRRAIQRNIHSIDFHRINTMADQGAGQATQIQNESGRLHHMVLDNLQVTENKDQELKLLQLARHLKELNRRQMELVRELQRLPDDYHQNSYKLFRKRTLGVLPSMEEVLRRVCCMPEGDAAAVGREFIAMFDPPVQISLFDPGAIIDTISQALERRSTTGDKSSPLQEIDGESIAHYQAELTEPLMKRGRDMILNRVRTCEATMLEDLLNEAALEEDAPLLPMAVALTVFQSIMDHRTGQGNGFQVKLGSRDKYISIDLPGGRRYRGDHLVLVPVN